jgi:uncharacterized peroxidase-related enzyme
VIGAGVADVGGSTLCDMSRQDERTARSKEAPIVHGLPDAPGILAAIRLTPGLGAHLRGLADELLVKDFPGTTLTRAEREIIATAVSAANDCFYCMDSHGAFAGELLRRSGEGDVATIDSVKSHRVEALSEKLQALVAVALIVQRDARALTRDDVARAIAKGASDADTQLAVLIASAFCMYNRMVDGFRAPTPPSTEAFTARAKEIAEHGYSDPRVQSEPR